MQTQYQIATLKKGLESITDYFHKAKTLATSLSAAGQPLSPSEFTIYLLVGLGSDYESLVTSITTQPDPLSSSQINSYLLNHESRLANQTQSLLSSAPHVANTTITSPSSSSTPPNRGRECGFRRGRGGGCAGFHPLPTFFSNPSTHRPTCLVCHKSGHTTLSCYHRFNQAYQASALPSLTANYIALPSSSAHFTNWFPDTVATNHCMAYFSNLNIDSTLYQGTDQVNIEAGSTLSIQNTGSAHLYTPFGASSGIR
ncbi:hypothetical protein F2P56_005442 [Juglans regia]|uniref:Uncharacterized protein LOC108984235 isoform X2 n=2 Tax=Juglans regia TaxID=51240 RepID=A0A2I4DX12_JUGRE|nr:uncharacterized protein LOC108984235 isoform X2 [Juglans regia]KAF5478921.1 hypothetical protein F2P56_005442 [Juglans regia]